MISTEANFEETKTTTCYMCAGRCGIKVHLKDGKVRYIEGNKDHPINRGVLCAKGAAGIMQHYSPARLHAPLKRVGPRGSSEFVEIGWDEALTLATEWLSEVRTTNPRKLAFFTGRDQSQALTGWFAQAFGTPNFAAHGGFCSVSVAAAGLYTFGGSFWEFGEPDWERTKYFILFGVAEDHASNPIKAALGRLKERGVKVVAVNPIRTGYQAIADEWIGIRPGTDGLLVGGLIHELLRTRQIDLDYLVRYTNAPWLVIDSPGDADHGLFARDQAGQPLCFDKLTGATCDATKADIAPILAGTAVLADGRSAVPALQLIAARFLSADYSPEPVAAATGVPATTIRRLAAELADVAFRQEIQLDIPWIDWAGRRHDKIIGRPVSMHAMRGVAAHTNGFQTCRLLHLLQILLGCIDCPGGFRYKPPFPRPAPPPVRPAGKAGSVKAGTPLSGPPLGFPMGPEDLLVDEQGRPLRIDKAFSWEAPLAAHGLMHSVIANAAAGDPYPIDLLFLYMANMSWNSSMQVGAALEHLMAKDDATGAYRIPRIIYSDAYFSEMVPYADLILPDTTYLERWDCISLLDRAMSDPDEVADGIRQPVTPPDRDVRAFQSVLLDLGTRLCLPGFVTEDNKPKYPGGYADYLVNHERTPGIGSLACFRGPEGKDFGRGSPNPRQLERYVENGCFAVKSLAPDQRFLKHANKAYLDWAKAVGFIGTAEPIIFQLYLEPMQKFRLSAQGHGAACPPEADRTRIQAFFDPIPFWYPPIDNAGAEAAGYTLHAVTQRPMQMYHSWGAQNAWLRQISTENRLYIHHDLGWELGVTDDDWVWVISDVGRIKCQLRLMNGVQRQTVWTWNAIGKRAGTWGLANDAPEAARGFLLNHLIPELLPRQPSGERLSFSDPITGQAAWYDLRVRLEKAGPDEASQPRFEPIQRPGRKR